MRDCINKLRRILWDLLLELLMKAWHLFLRLMLDQRKLLETLRLINICVKMLKEELRRSNKMKNRDMI